MDCLGYFYPETAFGGFTNVDGTISFYARVNALLHPQFTILDIGCGPGSYARDPVRVRRELRVLRGKCKTVIGIDVDPLAERNPFVDDFRLIAGETWPVADRSVDMCLCDNVLEHVARPHAFLRECRRVLKPSSYLCVRTPNVLGYVGLASKLVPNKWHAAVLRRA